MKEKSRIWNLTSNTKGDKVIWMILILLMLVSVVAIFSSTSTLATATHSRTDILQEHILLVLIGMAVVLAVFRFASTKILRGVSQWMYLLCVIMLGLLLSHESVLPVKAATINNVWRILKIGNFQIHIFEIIKVAMVMYLSWAIDTYKNGEFTLLEALKRRFPDKKWLGTNFTKKLIYIYMPIATIFVGILPGSGTAALFTFLIMFMTVLIGGLDIKEVLIPGFGLLAVVLAFLVVNHVVGYSMLKRQATWEERIKGYDQDIQRFKEARRKSKEYYDALAEFQQQYSAKVAVKQGGLIGKGPGKSTQRYKVPVMYADYMYSFIIEEYGLAGGLLVMMLFLSLLARGSIVAEHCKDNFSKVLVAGLVILISGQAMVHIMVNADVIPMTGQTLPLISHGKSAFLVFCGAFGILLATSKNASKAIEKETRMAEPIIENEDYERV